MIWSFIAVFFSGWLYVDASYRGPTWQRWIFKPLTLTLLLLLALQAPMFAVTEYLILAGLIATLIGDTLTLISGERLLYAFGAFFLSHLLYTLYFASQITLSLYWPLPTGLFIVGVLLLAVIWNPLEDLRMPVTAFIGMTLVMVWLAGERYFVLSDNRSFTLFIGTILLLLSNIVWLISKYRFRFAADKAITAACYFGGHFLIVRSLYT